MRRAALLLAFAAALVGGCRCGARRADRGGAVEGDADAGGTVTTGVMMVDIPMADGGLAPDAQRYRAYRDDVTRNAGSVSYADRSAPTGFGYKIGWIAVPTSDAARLIEQLGIGPARPAPFVDAMEAAYDGRATFVTPAIDGWTLLVGSGVLEADLGRLEAVLVRLSAEHGEAHAYLTHRVFEYHGYLVAREGRLIRAHVYDGEAKGLLRDSGAHLAEEAGLPSRFEGPVFMTPTGMIEDGKLPPAARHEGDVMIVAAALSVRPTDLGPGSAVTGQALLAAPLQLE